MSLKEVLLRNLTNIPGWRSNRKIVVFESDDWGSTRMPSKKAYNNLLKAGIRVDRSKYDTLDALETGADLTNLLEILNEVRTSTGRPAIFTVDTVMTNPDFDRIKESNFTAYYKESFFDSYINYYGQDLKPLWSEAIANKLIQPQFHAREHLNTSLWINDLRLGNKETRAAFDQSFYGLKTKTSSSVQNHYLAAYWAETPADIAEKAQVASDGLNLFEKEFSFRSSSIIACNYIWPAGLERQLSPFGIKYFQGQRVQQSPLMHQTKSKAIHHFTGQRNTSGQVYLVRNVLFEPFMDTKRDWVASSLIEISNSFFWKKPAIISSHRINFAGNMDIQHRDRNLQMLRKLIRQILERWPDVEFMSSDELGELITKNTV